MVSEFVGTVWENGEFGVAIAAREQPECPFDLNKAPLTAEEAEWNRSLIKVHGAIEVLKFKGVDPLGLSPRLKNHKRELRGQKGISAHGKRLVRNACHRLEQETDKSLLTFATFTLPNVSVDESLFISENWGEIQRVFIQKLGRCLRKESLPGEIVGAVEIQERRFERDSILALHLHLVFVGRRKGGTWAISPSEYCELWKEVLQKYLFAAPETYDWRAVHNVQRVKKSVEGYLGKYVTKGVKSISRVVERFGAGCLPSHWYTCTNSLRKRVIEHRTQVSGLDAKTIVTVCMDYPDVFFVYRTPIEVDMPSGKRITVGWFGKIKPEYIDLFTGKGMI